MMAKKIDKWLMHLFYKIWFIPAVLCAGYMFFEDESIGWIIAGFVGGALLPFMVLGAIEGILEGLFGKTERDPLAEAADRAWRERTAWHAWKTGKPY